jgi:hypothetical protein
MGTANEACAELEKDLARVVDDAQAAVAGLDAFEMHVGTRAALGLALKVTALALCINERSQQLWTYHGGQGLVFAALSAPNGIEVSWTEKPALVSNRAWYASFGWTIMLVPEVLQLLNDLVRQLRSGEYEKVLSWYRLYGRGPGLDVDGMLPRLGLSVLTDQRAV